jgi:hypothetical protein
MLMLLLIGVGVVGSSRRLTMHWIQKRLMLMVLIHQQVVVVDMVRMLMLMVVLMIVALHCCRT